MNVETANRICIHLQRLTGVRPIAPGPHGSFPETWGDTSDPRVVLERIDALRDHGHVRGGEQGRLLLAFGDALRVELEAK
jgi:hypothetical protein